MEYSHERKKKLANTIGKLKKRDNLIKILTIIKENNPDLETSNNNNGVFMMFHNLNDKTYEKIEEFLKELKSKSTSESLSETSEKIEYQPYAMDEFPSQDVLSPKLKYSNKEKNIIKRKKYTDLLTSDENKDVIYKEY